MSSCSGSGTMSHNFALGGQTGEASHHRHKEKKISCKPFQPRGPTNSFTPRMQCNSKLFLSAVLATGDPCRQCGRFSASFWKFSVKKGQLMTA